MYLSQGQPPPNPGLELARRKRLALAPLPPLHPPQLEISRRRHGKDKMILGRCLGEEVVGVCLECLVIILKGR